MALNSGDNWWSTTSNEDKSLLAFSSLVIFNVIVFVSLLAAVITILNVLSPVFNALLPVPDIVWFIWSLNIAFISTLSTSFGTLILYISSLLL